MSDIHKWSLKYAIGSIHVSIAYRLFYKSVVVRGKENIPNDRPVIFAPNHQNALMDPLALVCNVPGQTVFMARSDIFASPLVIKILRFLKILPVYRMRDGYSNLGKNEEVFDEALETLANNKKFCIMPEGRHNDKRFLLPLVKGPFRMAFSFIEKYPNAPKPVFVPVGIHYSDYNGYRAEKIIQFGKPIEVSDYVELYKESAPKAINALKDKIAESIKPLMLNIECGEHYETADFLRRFYRPIVLSKGKFSKNTSLANLEAEQWFVGRCNEAYKQSPKSVEALGNDSKKLNEVLTALGIRPERFMVKPVSLFKRIAILTILLLLFPVYLLGSVINYPPFLATFPILKKIKDPQFISSVRFTVTMFTFPLWYIILFVISSLIAKSMLIGACIILVCALMGEIAYRYKQIMIFYDEETKLKAVRSKISFTEADLRM